MIVELEKGKNENIKIKSNLKLEVKKQFFSSLSYLTDEILNLIENIPNIENKK